MGTKGDYRKANKDFLKYKLRSKGVKKLSGGVLYEEISAGEGDRKATLGDVIVVHYTGRLIDGTEFDSTKEGACPEAMRLRDTIEGWQIAVTEMRKGTKAKVYIPSTLAYGNKKEDNIPANSTLEFEIELLDIQ
ncbi:MAG: FKBP-type peptidyl-prolyl cis-trans isomerase [Muribaculaceae bacterium]|nr:FKBP-type peptidyl-prolyl cis-trans isomerase [Muribaculaceae bacterium]